MPRESKLGSEEECIEFSQGTAPATEGWWYHGATLEQCKALVSGKVRFTSQTWFTRDPRGAQHKRGHTHSIRAMVSLDEEFKEEWSIEDPAHNALTMGFEWLIVRDPRRIMVEENRIGPEEEAKDSLEEDEESSSQKDTES